LVSHPLNGALAAMVLCIAPLSSCTWTKAPPLPEGDVDVIRTVEASVPVEPRLGPGDRLHVRVWGHPEHSTPDLGLPLDPQGRIDLALLGPVSLDGLTLDEARERLRTELARLLREPQVSLTLLDSPSRRFYVFGEVERPGPYPLDRQLTALQGLALAGAFRPGADRFHVALLRGGRESLEVYFFNGATPGKDGMVALRPDDFVFVRLSGAGTFRDQLLPIVQSIVPPITGLASLIVVADQLNE